MNAEKVIRSRSVTCPYCQASVNNPCVTYSGKVRDNHKDRWQRIQQRYKNDEMIYRLLKDDPRFGLKKDDLLICVNYPYDAKVTILRRLSDGYDPSCNQYIQDVEFINWHEETK